MGKAWFTQKYTLFVSRSTLGKLSCGSNVLFNWKFLKKYVGLSPQTYLKKFTSASKFSGRSVGILEKLIEKLISASSFD